MSNVPQLPGVLRSLAPLLDSYGYAAVGALVFLEDFGVPVPGETILIAAAVYAGAGRLSPILVAVIGFLAASLGDNVGYAIGHFGGRPLALRLGRYVFLTEERLDTAEGFFKRHGGKVVTVARFIEGLRQANGIVAGITEMPWPKFLFYNALGAALWVGLWVAVGLTAGSHISAVYHTIVHYELYALVVVVLAVLLGVARHLHRRAARAATSSSRHARIPGSPDSESASSEAGDGPR